MKLPRVRYDLRILLLALLAGLPGTVYALAMLATADLSGSVRITGMLALAGVWIGFAHLARVRVVEPLQVLANLLNALKHEDYSFQLRGGDRDDPLGLVFDEANALRALLRGRRLGALEATALLRTVMEEIDVAIFAFDDDDRVRLVNRAAVRLIGQPEARMSGRTAAELGLAELLDGPAPRTFEATFAGRAGRWELRRGRFRRGGRPHRILAISDLSRALREEERQAWQRLIRVLSHEINNSLAPISSVAGTLGDLIRRDPPPPDRDGDLRDGLSVIERRAAALSRFMTSYARMARLPPPKREPLEVGAWIERVVRLESRSPVVVLPGPSLTIEADEDQLEQVLINLIQNAAEASAETGGRVEVSWSRDDGELEIRVEDEGPGIDGTSNLFVPFFTTKPHGTGIGLALSRQIAEAHGGTLLLENRPGARGARATLRLPVGEAARAREISGDSRG